MSKDTLNVGLIGYGLGGATFHAPFITRTPGLHLATVMTSDPARQAAVRERYPDAGVAANLDELLATKPDLIAISSPNASHYPLAKAALEAGAHVVVDKPFAATAEQARELGALAARVGRIAIPFQNRRWDGDYLTVRRLIDDEIARRRPPVSSRAPIAGAQSANQDGAAPTQQHSPENIVHDLGTHLIDQALQLFGPVKRIYAELRRIDPKVVTSDDMFISLTHKSGVQSHLGSTMAAAIPGPRYNVLGTRGAYIQGRRRSAGRDTARWRNAGLAWLRRRAGVVVGYLRRRREARARSHGDGELFAVLCWGRARDPARWSASGHGRAGR